MKLCALPLIALATLTAQQSFQGQVVDALTAAPVGGVRVGQFVRGEIAMTDAAGHFQVEMTKGEAGVALNYPGYLPNGYGSYRVVEGGGDARFQLTPQAVIIGKIVDEDGIPVEGAAVAACTYGYLFGRRQLLQTARAVHTNEAGEYRLFNLPAGKYYIRVIPKSTEVDWDGQYGERFFPDATDASQADLIEVAAGQERHDVNMRLTKKEGVTISGRYTIPKGAAPPHITLRKADCPQTQQPYVRQVQSQSSTGQFVFTHVPPGKYLLEVPHLGPGKLRAGELSTSQEIEVGASNMHDVALDISPLAAIELKGKVVFQGDAKPAPITVMIASDYGERLTAKSQADGSIVIPDLLPGTHTIWVEGETASSIRLGGRDVLQSGFELGTRDPGPLEITVGDWGKATLSAKVVDASGHGIAGVTLLLWPLSGDRTMLLRTNADGTVQFHSAPAGDYHVYLPREEWRLASFDDPDFRRDHAADFPPVHLTPGGTTALTLPLK